MFTFKQYLLENLGDGKLKNREGEEYEIRHSRGINNEHTYDVHHKGRLIGGARLSHSSKYVVDLGIQREHQRKGLATALYNHIEKHLGHKLEPSPVHQTKEGKAFWKSRQ